MCRLLAQTRIAKEKFRKRAKLDYEILAEHDVSG